MARVVVPLDFNAFLEKAKMKDDGSNYMDWVRKLRIILIAAQKNCVLEAPLGSRPAAGVLRLELALVFPEEEGMMQHSSVSISLSF